MPQNPATARRVHHRWRLISGLTALGLGILIGVVIALRGNGALELDAEWMDEIIEHRAPYWEAPSLLMNLLGGTIASIVISLVIVVVLAVLRRPWTAAYFGLAALASTLLVQTLKALLSRARPEDGLINLTSGAFPSGHVANAATLAVAMAVILWRWWAVFGGAAYVVIMALSRTYLGAHWVSDTVGGLLIGGAVAVILWAPFAERVLFERTGDAVASKT